MTLTERAEAHRRACPQNVASWLSVGQERNHDVLYGHWVIGNDYRKTTTLYGSYPPTFLSRVMALFPDMTDATSVLHVFSGGLLKGAYQRCDVRQLSDDQEWVCDVLDLPARGAGPFSLVIADPPYSKVDAVNYGTPMVNRGKILRALAQVTRPGGFCVWLDTTWPMHRKIEWRTVGRITIVRSTNHRVRLATIFQRVAAC